MHTKFQFMHTKLEGTLETSAATTISKILHRDSGLL